MNKNIYIIVGLVLLLLIILISIVFMRRDKMDLITDLPGTPVEQRQGEVATGTDQRFSGTITAVDTSCFSDGICSVTIDNAKKIILVKGGRGQPQDIKVGKLLGAESIGSLEQMIGQDANVYVTTTIEGDFSIYGNDSYYVEVVMPSKQ